MRKPVTDASAAVSSVQPSRALAAAALAGLLCAAAPACTSDDVDAGTEGGTDASGGAGGASTRQSGGAANGGHAASSGGTTAVGDASSSAGGVTGTGGVIGVGGQEPGAEAGSAGGTPPDATVGSTGGTDSTDGGWPLPPPGDAGVNCAMDGGPPTITATTVVSDMTQERFTTECNARHGVVEIPPHCGGFNTCMGFSYWADTGELTEHTCKGMSSCVGFSCVVCPPSD